MIMNRRKFLAMLGLAGASATIPFSGKLLASKKIKTDNLEKLQNITVEWEVTDDWGEIVHVGLYCPETGNLLAMQEVDMPKTVEAGDTLTVCFDEIIHLEAQKSIGGRLIQK